MDKLCHNVCLGFAVKHILVFDFLLQMECSVCSCQRGWKAILQNCCMIRSQVYSLPWCQTNSTPCVIKIIHQWKNGNLFCCWNAKHIKCHSLASENLSRLGKTLTNVFTKNDGIHHCSHVLEITLSLQKRKHCWQQWQAERKMQVQSAQPCFATLKSLSEQSVAKIEVKSGEWVITQHWIHDVGICGKNELQKSLEAEFYEKEWYFASQLGNSLCANVLDMIAFSGTLKMHSWECALSKAGGCFKPKELWLEIQNLGMNCFWTHRLRLLCITNGLHWHLSAA